MSTFGGGGIILPITPCKGTWAILLEDEKPQGEGGPGNSTNDQTCG